jgi:hypothetical protein
MPSLKILLQGSYHPNSRGDSEDQLMRAESFARTFARELIREGFDLVVTGIASIDEVAGRAAREACLAAGENPKRRVTAYSREAPPSNFIPFGNVRVLAEKSWAEIRAIAVEECDALVALLGGKGTTDASQRAEKAKKCVAPVALAGGAGLNEWLRLWSAGYYHVTPGDIDFLGDFRISPEEVAIRLVRQLAQRFGMGQKEKLALHVGPAVANRDASDKMQGGIALFLSHSSADADLAEALVRVVEKALLLPASKIRCTSVDGYRLAAGDAHVDVLRRELLEAGALVGLLTTRSLTSEYVLFELGARWGAGRRLVPTVARGVSAGSLRAPLSALTAIDLTSERQVIQLVSELGDALGNTPQRVDVFMAEISLVVELAKRAEMSASTSPPPAPVRVPVDVKEPVAERTLDYDKFRQLCAKLADKYDDFYLAGEIPKPMLRTARGRLKLQQTEDVLAFLDNTLGYSGTDGVAFTPSAIVWRNNHQEAVHRLSYQQLASFKIIANNGEDEVRVGMDAIDLSGSNVEPSALAPVLRNLGKVI